MSHGMYVKTYFLHVFICVCLHLHAEVRDNLWVSILTCLRWSYFISTEWNWELDRLPGLWRIWLVSSALSDRLCWDLTPSEVSSAVAQGLGSGHVWVHPGLLTPIQLEPSLCESHGSFPFLSPCCEEGKPLSQSHTSFKAKLIPTISHLLVVHLQGQGYSNHRRC